MQDEGDTRHWLPPVENGRPQVLTTIRKKRGDVVALLGNGGGREYRSLAAPLDFYVANKHITGAQYHAGRKLLRLWVHSVRSPYSQMIYGERDGAGMPEHFPIGMFAVEYRNAILAVRGDNERKVVHAVCCEDISASRCLPYPSKRTAQRLGVQYLVSGLDDLIRHFKDEIKRS